MNKLVVVGNGMAGVGCVEQILKHAPKFEITIFGDETHVNYNRILLSSVLAGEKAADDIVLNALEWYKQNEIELRLGVRITDIDTDQKTVTGDDGSVTPFDKLLLATGSSPLIPPIEGVRKDGVFVFRTLDDTRALLERARTGIESRRHRRRPARTGSGARTAGAGMRRDRRPPDGHTDGAAARPDRWRLPEIARWKPWHPGAAGAKTPRRFSATERSKALRFEDGSSIEADLVVIAAGIRPNVELAKKSRACKSIAASSSTTTWRRRIRTSSRSANASSTTASAMGWWRRCSSRARCWRRRSPGNKGPRYEGTVHAAKLKIMGVDVFSAGELSESAPGTDVVRYEDRCARRLQEAYVA